MIYVTVAYLGQSNLEKQERFIWLVGRFKGSFCGSGFDVVDNRQDLTAKFAILSRDQEKKLRSELKKLDFEDIQVRTITVDNWPTKQSFA